MTLRVGLIVNPVAGLGGSVGLKGSDGLDIVRRARELGAVPHAGERAAAALEIVVRSGLAVEILTSGGPMGEDSARAAGLAPVIVWRSPAAETTGEDTRRAAASLREAGADLLVVAGGDGTARDIVAAIGEALPVIGIPAGVKIHSAVYAVNPRAAGDLVVGVLRAGLGTVREAEVMDVDEDAYRNGQLTARLYGYLRVPGDARLVQAGKVRSRSEDASAELLGAAVADAMEPGVLYLLGPGTTVRRVARSLGFEGTLLGVDLVRDRHLVASDLGERALLDALSRTDRARIIVTPIGGQGYLFGRGNQQLSSAVIKAVGRDHVIVIATPDKLAALGGRPLLVDTGDEALDNDLAGYMAVWTGPGRRAMYPVAVPRAEP